MALTIHIKYSCPLTVCILGCLLSFIFNYKHKAKHNNMYVVLLLKAEFSDLKNFLCFYFYYRINTFRLLKFAIGKKKYKGIISNDTIDCGSGTYSLSW